MKKHAGCLYALCFAVLLLAAPRAFCAPIADEAIPPELRQWKAWALFGEEDTLCPTPYNNPDQHLCAFPGRFSFDLIRTGGSFTGQVLVLAETWVVLPGGPEQWPQRVTANGKPAAVVGRDEGPALRLAAGTYDIKGAFDWRDMPEVLFVPKQCGIVALRLNGAEVPFPVLEGGNRLWLQKRAAAGQEEERLDVKIFRRLKDDIPFKVRTTIRLNVSGTQREVRLAGVLPDGAAALGVSSPLPLRLGGSNELLIQARPGQWDLSIDARLEGPVQSLGPIKAPYGQEVWAFEAQSQLRMVSIEGAQAVDPQRTDMPQDWRSLPAYLMQAGDTMTFRQTRRGDPDPAPDQVHVRRTWWLDFDGGGYTVQDRLTGRMSRQWYLAVNKPMQLGRVAIDGADQLITGQGPGSKPGVELRRGELNLTAESRIEQAGGTLPAVGWDHDAQSVAATLVLPPGWKIFAASGVDAVPGTWFERWTLLDFFIALIITMAIWKLYGRLWGLAGLVVMGLTYHEPGAPRLVWVSLLAAAGLLRVLPEGRVKKLAQYWRLASLVCLIALSIPFAVQQVRWGMYPQLDTPYRGGMRGVAVQAPAVMEQAMDEAAPAPELDVRALSRQKVEYDAYRRIVRKSELLSQDPKALIQTGPGLPSWSWRSYDMKWSGPLAKDHRMRLWLLSPGMNLVLNFSRVLFLLLLILGVCEVKRLRLGAPGAAAAAFLALVLCSPPARAADALQGGFPPPELLQQLKDRLQEQPDCFPQCADSPRLELTVQTGRISIMQEIDAVVDAAVPLPGHVHAWSPAQVTLDGSPAAGLVRGDDGLLWLLVPRGAHRIVISGRAPAASSFQLLLPLKPRLAEVSAAQGWDVQGIDSRGQAEASLQLTRTGPALKAEAGQAGANGIVLPPFFSVERHLLLGLTWQVETTVKRLSPAGSPATLAVPLLAGESVTTAGIRAEKGRALITFDARATEVRWSSTLAVEPSIGLQAPESVAWVETWVLDASPIWHCTASGIPVVHHQDEAGYWKPRWRPWPGETVTIAVTRPAALPGQTITVDDARMQFTPGRRIDTASLTVKVRASQGAGHAITLPEGASLQKVAVDGRTLPIREHERKVVVSLQPGSQTIAMEWNRQSAPRLITRGPEVDLGIKAVNAAVSFVMPPERWILLAGGPRLGPAVLFWSYFIVVLIAAVLLGKIPWSPLSRLQWVLLGIGLTQIGPLQALLVAGWLLALELRQKQNMPGDYTRFNFMQVILVVWTLAALVCLYAGVERGLLHLPDMQIVGNGSTAKNLNWLQDRIDGLMPRPWVVSVPLLAYRVIMLMWSLWLALSLLKWLRRGWVCFSTGGVWKKKAVLVKPDAPEGKK